MSVRRLAEVQPASFAFTPENQAWAEREIAKYPPGRQASAIISLLWRAQAQHDYWLPKPAIETVADMLGMPYIRALEVATFYTMFNLEPVGRHHVQVCGTTPCVLRGAEDIKRVCRSRIGPEGKVTGDGKLSWVETECLGACANAPAVQINTGKGCHLDAHIVGHAAADLGVGVHGVAHLDLANLRRGEGGSKGQHGGGSEELLGGHGCLHPYPRDHRLLYRENWADSRNKGTKLRGVPIRGYRLKATVA